mgnify:CR=1 FL=1
MTMALNAILNSERYLNKDVGLVLTHQYWRKRHFSQ